MTANGRGGHEMTHCDEAVYVATLMMLYVGLPDTPWRPPPLAPIRSLAYFQPVIAELQQQPLPAGYLDYLRLKFQKVAALRQKA